MSSSSRLFADEESSINSVYNSATTEHECSSTSSNSSTIVRAIKSTSDLPLTKSKYLHRKYKHSPYNTLSKTKLNTKGLKNAPKSHNIRYSTVATENAIDEVDKEYYEIKSIGSVNLREPFVCSIYITSYNVLHGNIYMQVGIEPLMPSIDKIATGRIRMRKTCCGLIIAFAKEADAENVMKLPLQSIFGGPIQVARFFSGEYKYCHNILLRDIPWCISNLEIQQALKMQGICAGKVLRTRAHVKVEVLNALDVQRLVEEGLNFFNSTSFNAVPETNVNQGEPDIVQCFKCQGFWHTSTHCRQMPRCVRCGENHDVEYCPRPRSTPTCCHCGGPHHAAYKMCPVRLQHINSTYVGFQLAKNKPNRFVHKNIS